MFKNKRGQLTLGDAPTVVLLVGLVFLVMATMALLGQKYGESMPTDDLATSVNESVTQAARDTGSGYLLANTTLCNAENFAILQVINATGGAVDSANYTLSASGLLTNKTGGSPNPGTWRVTYTTEHSGVGCDVNEDLQTEISDNTSIAGIVLTISLVGIVLTVLIGIFVGMRRRNL